MAGKHELQNFNLKGVSSQVLFTKIDRKLTTPTLPLEGSSEATDLYEHTHCQHAHSRTANKSPA